jgi:hypothetical protein
MDYHEFFATRTAASFFDLDGEQKERFLKHWRAFTQKVALTKADAFLSNLKSFGSLNDPSKDMDKLQHAVSDVLLDACSDFAPLLADLDQKQVAHFKEELEERNQKFDPEKQGGLAKYRKANLEDLVARVKNWLGRVSTAQEELLRRLEQERSASEGGAWEAKYLAYSREAQSQFISILSKNSGQPDKIATECKSFVEDQDRFLSADAKAFKSKLAKYREYFLKSIFSSAEQDQKRHLTQEIIRLAEDLASWVSKVKR